MRDHNQGARAAEGAGEACFQVLGIERGEAFVEHDQRRILQQDEIFAMVSFSSASCAIQPLQS